MIYQIIVFGNRYLHYVFESSVLEMNDPKVWGTFAVFIWLIYQSAMFGKWHFHYVTDGLFVTENKRVLDLEKLQSMA